MKHIWLVTDGDYSDYHIEGAFSTRAKALTAIVNRLVGGQIERFELDSHLNSASAPLKKPPQRPKGRYLYHVEFRGGKTEVRREGPERECNALSGNQVGWFAETGWEDAVEVTLWAPNRAAAVKVASEKRRLLVYHGARFMSNKWGGAPKMTPLESRQPMRSLKDVLDEMGCSSAGSCGSWGQSF